jgi:hypothetical protein
MQRIELWMTVFAGLSGGLAGVLWGGIVTRWWLAPGAAPGVEDPPAETAWQVLAGAALRAAAGAALGFLFWLGWGLIALIGTPWYSVGMLYGALAWIAVAAPVLGTLRLHGHGSARALTAHAVEWLFTCLAVGLLCALAWHRYA